MWVPVIVVRVASSVGLVSEASATSASSSESASSAGRRWVIGVTVGVLLESRRGLKGRRVRAVGRALVHVHDWDLGLMSEWSIGSGCTQGS